MITKWTGSFDDLKAFVQRLNFTGNWQNEGDGKETFMTRSNGMLNYWHSSNTINFQGKGCLIFKNAFDVSIKK